MVDAEARIICNLTSGGTNPDAIRRLPCRVRQVNNLHAKVYLAKDRAIVTSANASANGLGLEGTEQAFWREAGILTRNTAAIEKWFEATWAEASEITEDDLRQAEENWRERQKARPSRVTFADFDPEASDFPLVAWQSPDLKWKLVDEAFAELGGSALASQRARADKGLEVN